VDEL
jgi:hypothetical protein